MYSPNDVQTLQTKLHILGFLPGNYSLRENLSDLYRDQAGAYYDPNRKSIVVLPGDLPEKSLYFVMLHELVHAYQDQKFNLKQLRNKYQINGNLDQKITFGFLIEGHANLVSVASLFPQSKLNDQFFRNPTHRSVFSMMAQFTEISPREIRSLGRLIGSEFQSSLTHNLNKLKGTPRFLLQLMMDPYLFGQKLWFDRAETQGWKATENWLESPPNGTRKILYPEGKNIEHTNRSNRLGTYLILRWTNTLRQRPVWGKGLSDDQAKLLETKEEQYLRWDLRFTKPTYAEEFLKSVNRLTPGELEPGTTSPFQNNYTKRDRTIRYCRSGKKITLLVNTEPFPPDVIHCADNFSSS